jgi:4-amino-4-deoxy-L-arabinose transferase-like glycosyltransferase
MDEAAEGLDALRLLHQPGYHPIFFDNDGGREAPFAYAVAAAFKVAGPSTAVLRGVAAFFGVLGVLAIFLALRRFGRVPALVGMAYAAGALWLIAVSRDGFRNVLVPLTAALAFWALTRWADRPARGSAVVAGALVAAGLWTYQPLKLMPLAALLWLAWIWRADVHRAGGALGTTWLGLRATRWWALAAAGVVAAPMLLVAMFDAANYFGRAAGVSPFVQPLTAGGLLDHTLRTLGMFAISGDPNERHNVGGLPLLGWPLFVLTLFGAWRAWRRRREPSYALLLIGIPVFMLPPLLALEGSSPHFLRSLGLAPFLAGLIGIGVVEAAERLASAARRPRWQPALAGAAGVLVVALGAASAQAYFSRPVSQRYDAYTFALIDLGTRAAAGQSTVLIDDYQAMVVTFVAHDHLPTIVNPGTRLRPSPGTTVYARSRAQLGDSLGADALSHAAPVGRDPQGRPVAWAISY